MKLILGESLEVLRKATPNSIDAIVTDPPYGLSFMGKKWDYDVPSVELWKECLRVLKPGGYLLSFAGTRTQHRMAVNIEDAGFEIRDMIAWVYGSGFPKSHNIGKAVDKKLGNKREVTKEYEVPDITGDAYGTMNEKQGGSYKNRTHQETKGNSPYEGWGTALKPSWESITVAQKGLDSSSVDMVELVYNIKKILCQSQSNAKTVEKVLKSNQQEQSEDVNTAQWIAEKNTNILEDLSVLTDMLRLEKEKNLNWNIVLLWLNILEDLYKAMNTATTSTELSTTTELKILLSMEWESIFQNIIQAKDNQKNGLSASVWNVDSIFNALRLKLIYTPELSAIESVISKEKEKEFAPNLEPIIMSRKPLSEKTVAENCLKWGTGGIQIDECRVGTEELTYQKVSSMGKTGEFSGQGATRENGGLVVTGEKTVQGRFPANLIHDGSDEVVEKFPDTKSQGHWSKTTTKGFGEFGGGSSEYLGVGEKDKKGGSASRFFYCAKASKKERNAGCEGLEEKKADKRSDTAAGMWKDKNAIQSNFHPTVKPIALMEYLVKLVSREGATVLDPFAGSFSTGVACVNLDRKFIGIEREEDYIKIGKARIDYALNKKKYSLFSYDKIGKVE